MQSVFDTIETSAYMRNYDLPDYECNKQLYDVSFGLLPDGTITSSLHSRKTGFTSCPFINRIEVWNQASAAVGGHCHWQEIHFWIGAMRYVLTPNYPKEFEKLCQQVNALKRRRIA